MFKYNKAKHSEGKTVVTKERRFCLRCWQRYVSILELDTFLKVNHMKKALLWIFLLVCPITLKAAVDEVRVEVTTYESFSKKHRHLVVLPVQDSDLYSTVWNGDTVNCRVFMDTPNSLGLKCSVRGYSASVDIDCSRHNSREKSAQLNFNGTSYADKVNLHAWCE